MSKSKDIHSLRFEGRTADSCAILSVLENADIDNETIATLGDMFYELTRDDGFRRVLTIELKHEPE